LTPEEFAREYGRQFRRSGKCYFDESLLVGARAKVRAPDDVTWPGGRLRLWKLPGTGGTPVLPWQAGAPAATSRILIGADCAEGLADGDASAAVAVDDATGQQVAAYHARVGVTEYAEDLHRLARMLGDAWIAVEANNHGHAVASWLWHHLGYRRVFREVRRDEGSLAPPSARLGLLTTVASKPAMLAAYSEAVKVGRFVALDAGLVAEMGSFLCLPGGGYGAAPGRNDDRVMGAALCQAGRGQHTPRCY
jgi:hypothetical protein